MRAVELEIFLKYLRARRLNKETYLKTSKAAIYYLNNNRKFIRPGDEYRLYSSTPNHMFVWNLTSEGHDFWGEIHRTELR